VVVELEIGEAIDRSLVRNEIREHRIVGKKKATLASSTRSHFLQGSATRMYPVRESRLIR